MSSLLGKWLNKSSDTEVNVLSIPAQPDRINIASAIEQLITRNYILLRSLRYWYLVWLLSGIVN